MKLSEVIFIGYCVFGMSACSSKNTLFEKISSSHSGITTDVSIGRYDALNGLLLKGDGRGGFSPLPIQQSGVYIPGNGKALVKLTGNAGNYLVAASQNKDVLKLFELNQKSKIVKVNPDDAKALIHFKDGTTEKEELYYGSSFLSQSGRFILVTTNVSEVEITDNFGKTRKISFVK